MNFNSKLVTYDEAHLRYAICKDKQGYYLVDASGTYVGHMPLEDIAKFVQLEELVALVDSDAVTSVEPCANTTEAEV